MSPMIPKVTPRTGKTRYRTDKPDAGAKFPVNSTVDIFVVFPNGAETIYPVGNPKKTACQVRKPLMITDFPFRDAKVTPA